ncbi:MAG: cation:proton antiporter [Geminicoccaceae bacterium]|nr:MAG: cation:proton antiporter [Geminicoccaceae bacterium]
MTSFWRHDRPDWTAHAVRWLAMQRVGVGLPLRLLSYAAIWWVITGGDGGWLWGLPAVLIAATFNPFPTTRRWRWRPRGALLFLPVFTWLSLRSAADVAWRALHPSRPVNPALLEFTWRLEGEQGRVFFANLINLMPGTLCVRFTEAGMTVHVLGDPADRMVGLERLEAVVAGLFEPMGAMDD